MINWFRNSTHRKYVYRIATAASLVAVGYGWIDSGQADLWLGFLGTALVTTLADANTGKTDDSAGE